jgi:hypothetical protein
MNCPENMSRSMANLINCVVRKFVVFKNLFYAIGRQDTRARSQV